MTSKIIRDDIAFMERCHEVFPDASHPLDVSSEKQKKTLPEETTDSSFKFLTASSWFPFALLGLLLLDCIIS